MTGANLGPAANQVTGSYREEEGPLVVAAPPQAGRSQQAVDPVGHAPIEQQVSLDDATRPLAHQDLPLTNQRKQGWVSSEEVGGQGRSSAPPPQGTCHSPSGPAHRSGRTARSPEES